jgi:lysosomal acid lipase/cholesteryl ester hydrolase
MGLYDVPAMVDYILDLTGHTKLTYFGYARGNQQMWYALAKDPDGPLPPKIERFVSLAPCAFQGVNNVRNYDGFFSTLMDYNISVIYGDDWTDRWNEMCAVHKEPCESLGSIPSGEKISVKDLMYQT